MLRVRTKPFRANFLPSKSSIFVSLKNKIAENGVRLIRHIRRCKDAEGKTTEDERNWRAKSKCLASNKHLIAFINTLHFQISEFIPPFTSHQLWQPFSSLPLSACKRTDWKKTSRIHSTEKTHARTFARSHWCRRTNIQPIQNRQWWRNNTLSVY